jgi:hypothetical protein
MEGLKMFKFRASIEAPQKGYSAVVHLPDALGKKLPLKEHPRLRIKGKLGKADFSGAWQPQRGRWFLMVSKNLMQRAAVQIGDMVQVHFVIDDQDAVVVPTALQELLAVDPTVADLWEKLSAGKKRGWAFRIQSAKGEATIDKRLVELVEYLETGKIPGRKSSPSASLNW